MKQRDIILLLAPVALLVAAWIIFNIYHNSVTSTISAPLDKNILPISPNFDTQTIDNLKKRDKILPVYELQNQKPQQGTTSASQNESTLNKNIHP